MYGDTNSDDQELETGKNFEEERGEWKENHGTDSHGGEGSDEQNQEELEFGIIAIIRESCLIFHRWKGEK